MMHRSQDLENIKIEYSHHSQRDSKIKEEDAESYIEFVGLTKVRRGTEVGLNENSEKIINDIVAMDATFDAYELPDFSKGRSSRPLVNKVLNERYANFHTIDWLKDKAKDRFRHKWLQEQKKYGFFEKIHAWHDAASGWFCVLLVGLGAGIVAGMVDIGSGWTGNIKSGICTNAFWLNREQCCWASKDVRYDAYKNVMCENWKSWNVLLNISNENTSLRYFISLFFHVTISILFAVSAAVLVKFYAPYACGSGVPEIKTILSGFVIRGYLGKWTLLIKSLGMILGNSAGLTLGKEGPFVHVASCCGNIFSYLFPKYGKNEAKKREILSAAASAGVAVAFGAPIGGVLFSLEEVSYYFPLKTLWRSFFCAMSAAFIVRTVNPYGRGHDVLFFIEYKADWLFFELIPFIFLGILGGCFGFIFIKSNIFWCNIRKTTKLGKFPITEVCVITLITALIGYFNEYTRMSLPELIRRLVSKCNVFDDYLLCDYIREANVTSLYSPAIGAGPGVYEAIWKLILATLFYGVMLIFTFGIKIPCGLFVPCLAIGAICGRIVGIGMELWAINYPDFFLFSAECKKSEECVIPGIYALVGACAFLGGATRMTVSLVVIMVELTSGLSLIVPLMVAAFTAKLFGELLCSGGIYDLHINLNGYPFLDNKNEYIHSKLASDVMKPQKHDPPLITISQENMSVSEIESITQNVELHGFPIVFSKESQYLFGYIEKRDLKMAFDQYRENGLVNDSTEVKFTRGLQTSTENNFIRLFKLVDLAPICVTQNTPMEVVMDIFRKMGVSIILVTHFGKLIGVITKKDILKHLEKENEKEK